MPKVQYTQVDYEVNADIEDIAVFNHEVQTTVDLSDLEREVLNAIAFENAHDLLEWANDKKDISYDEIHQCLKENELGTPIWHFTDGKKLAEYSLAELFEEMLRRHIGQAI